jgi:hypothetical protein
MFRDQMLLYKVLLEQVDILKRKISKYGGDANLLEEDLKLNKEINLLNTKLKE